MNEPLAAPERALAIGAHPDDIEFGCGATLARWAAAGTEIHLLVLTDGSKGSWDEGDDLAALVGRREAEARDAARVLGNGVLHWVGLVDGELEHTVAERLHVVRAIREIGPDVVLGHDPWMRYRLHPDHRHAGWLTIDGVVAARDPHFFPGIGGSHHRPELLLLFEADAPDHAEPVETTIDAKVASLLCHRSQWHTTMGIDAGSAQEGEQRAAFADRIEREARAAGARHGFDLAEEFKLLRP